jgi:hypothetical protein
MECSYIAGNHPWRIGDHPLRKDHTALFDNYGRVRVTFAIWQTLDDLKADATRLGYVIHDDNTVTRADGKPMGGV